MSQWQLLPVRDSDGLVAQLRADHMMSRSRAAEMGHESLAAQTSGMYRSAGGAWIDWAAEVAAARDARLTISPDDALPSAPARASHSTRVTVGNLATLGAARELVDQGRRPLALNFANGVTPGGGWLGGARAQEEYLCRSSALYSTIVDDPMYEAHRMRDDYESTSWAILSPDVPVFRADDGSALDRPWLCSFITMAAPVADRVGQPRSQELMAARIERLLAVAAAFGYTDLVLGAWGCGAFGNDVDRTAEAFVTAITGAYAGTFAEVVFAVRDWSDERATLGAFARAWAQAAERREIRRPINLDDGDLNADWIKHAGRARRGDRELG